MKVLQLISSGGYYGAESMLLNLCVSQQRAGCHNTPALFYNDHRPNIELYERARRDGLEARIVRCRGRVDSSTICAIRELIREGPADLVHTHGYKADLYGYLAAHRECKPVVATCHNWVGGTAPLGVYNFLDRMVLKKVSAVAAVSSRIAQNLVACGVASNRVRVIANGVDADAMNCSPPASILSANLQGEKVIGMVARLDLQKGFEYLLRALSELGDWLRTVRVIVVGDGPDRAAIQGMVQASGLQSRVLFAGQRSDMPAVYSLMDIFVLPSLDEGLPMTVLEAMAAGKPVIATRVGAIPTVVRDGETGLLVEPRDALGLRSAIARLLADADLCQRLGNQARDWVSQHYTSSATARKYRQMYEEVLHHRENLTAAPAELLNARDMRAGD
jgi:glycosyltransferase involved in cell wall biosynthesis